MTAHTNPHLHHSRHARVTGIVQSGGTADDVARLLQLDRDAAISAMSRARDWHRRHPGDYTAHAIAAGLPREVILGGPACAEVDPELFFLGDLRGKENTYDHARKVCLRCPVRLPCAEYAIADPALAGMWGGLTPQERVDLRRQRRDKK